MRIGGFLTSLVVMCLPAAAGAQFAMLVPDTAPDPETVFANQCGTCHSLTPGEQRQGPNLAGVFGRQAGRLPGYAYSAGLAGARWRWDATRLDAWIANPQAMVPDTVMPYHQPDPEIRGTIIAFLKEQR